MKKFLYIAARVSLAAVIGLANIALADEKEEPKTDEDQQVGCKFCDSKSNTATAVKKDKDGGDKDDPPKGSGDPLKGLNVTSCKNYPKGKCPTANKPDDDEGGDPKKKDKDK